MYYVNVLEAGHWRFMRSREKWPLKAEFDSIETALKAQKERRPEACSVKVIDTNTKKVVFSEQTYYGKLTEEENNKEKSKERKNARNRKNSTD